jgi:hypothetical protein
MRSSAAGEHDGLARHVAVGRGRLGRQDVQMGDQPVDGGAFPLCPSVSVSDSATVAPMPSMPIRSSQAARASSGTSAARPGGGADLGAAGAAAFGLRAARFLRLRLDGRAMGGGGGDGGEDGPGEGGPGR